MATTLMTRTMRAPSPGELVIDPAIAARFYEHVNKRPGEDACWIWTYATDTKSGAPRFALLGTQADARRVAWELEGRSSTAGIRLVNTRGCDSRCVRPDHHESAGSLPGRPPKGVFPVKGEGDRPPMPTGMRLAAPRTPPTPRVRAESAQLPSPPQLEPLEERAPASLSDTDVVNLLDRSITTIVRGPNYVIVYGREHSGEGRDLRAAAASLAAKEARDG